MGRESLKRAAHGLVLVPLVVLVTACGGSSGGGSTSSSYPSAAKTNFLTACESRASSAACTCEFSYITQHVSFKTFAAADKALRAGTGGIPAWLLAAARSCVHAQTTTT
jgi:hypothetical protein